jgi:putative hydrolase of the HAD superfamily
VTDTNQLLQLIRQTSQPLEPISTSLEPRLEKMDSIRAVLFDVYGTMFASGCGEIGTAVAVDRAAAATDALAEVAAHPTAEAGQACVEGLTAEIERDHQQRRASGIEHPEVEIREIWERTIERLIADGQIAPDGTIQTDHLSLTYECRVNAAWPMPNLTSTLQAIREAGHTLGIVSNAQFFTPLLFDALLDGNPATVGFAPENCIWSFEHREAKPSPHLFDLIVQKLKGVRPDQMLYIGNDVRNDIGPAAKVGMHTALFAGDKRSLRLRQDDPTCQGVVPNIVVTDLSQILEIVPH